MEVLGNVDLVVAVEVYFLSATKYPAQVVDVEHVLAIDGDGFADIGPILPFPLLLATPEIHQDVRPPLTGHSAQASTATPPCCIPVSFNQTICKRQWSRTPGLCAVATEPTTPYR